MPLLVREDKLVADDGTLIEVANEAAAEACECCIPPCPCCQYPAIRGAVISFSGYGELDPSGCEDETCDDLNDSYDVPSHVSDGAWTCTGYKVFQDKHICCPEEVIPDSCYVEVFWWLDCLGLDIPTGKMRFQVKVLLVAHGLGVQSDNFWGAEFLLDVDEQDRADCLSITQEIPWTSSTTVMCDPTDAVVSVSFY